MRKRKARKSYKSTHLDLCSNIELLAVNIIRECKKVSAIHMGDLGLHYNHWLVLKLIYLGQADISRHLADFIGVEAATITKYVDQLEQRELITRNYLQEDKRVSKLKLTSKGVHLSKKTYDSYIGLLKNIEHSLSEKELTLWKLMIWNLSSNEVIQEVIS